MKIQEKDKEKEMKFRPAERNDEGQILELYRQAQAYFAANGIDQWQDGWPNAESLSEDIAAKESYVLEERGKILATAFISFRPEPDYEVIYEGNWQCALPCCVIHRVVVSEDCKGQGLGGVMICHAQELCREKRIGSIRIDTHRDNLSMQRMLKKNGFTCRGKIRLKRDGSERLAFEKVLSFG